MSYSDRNELTARDVGGDLFIRGTTDVASLVTVNGTPARMLEGNVFQAVVPAQAGPNTFTVAATDVESRVRTNTYQMDVLGVSATFTYDLNGNLTQKVEGATTWTYEWNAENQLTRVLSNGTEVARYKYDPLGRRVEKVVGTDVHAWLYDGEDILREIEGGTTFKFVHGPGIDEPLSREASPGVVIYGHADGLGSVIKMTDSSGQVIFTRQYDAFGNLEVGSGQGSYAFTGREWDPETGLYYYRARYYDPKIGRFISEDPAGFGGGLNFYSYVSGNPVNRLDPLGLVEYPANFVGPLPRNGYYTSQVLNTPCGRIPPFPRNVNINANMTEASTHVNPFWFRNQVRPGAPWDYKSIDPIYEDFGNLHYGAVGHASGSGFSDQTLFREAGRANLNADPSRRKLGLGDPGAIPTFGGTGPYYGDFADDRNMIQRGIDYCKCVRGQ